jgi:O-Antigen ligase
MQQPSIRSGVAQEPAREAGWRADIRRVDWSAVGIWLLGFGLVAYLGLEGGGYDPLIHDKAGIALCWIVLVGIAIGVLPGRRLSRLAWIALGLLALFVLWTGLSLSWTESAERTAADLARLSGYLGAFALAVFAGGTKNGRRLVAAVGAGAALVAIVALLSRLHPAWFPEAGQTARFLSGGRDRLSYPINYWNGLAALIAIGAPAVLQVASSARWVAARAAAAALLPAMALAAYFTLSRGGIAAACIGLALFLALSSDRLPKLASALLCAAGGAILIGLASHRDALQNALHNSEAHQQGNEMLLVTVILCLFVGLAQAGIALAERRGRRPSWTVVSRRQSRTAVAIVGLVVVIAALAFDVPGRVEDGWAEFKRGEGPGKGAARLGSVAGESRYQFWSAAIHENATKPLTGTGSGTFEYWWARDGDVPEIARDTHSLYLQTLGELGIVGLLLFSAFLVAVLGWGGRNVVRASRDERSHLAAALAGFAAFCITAISDWTWQIPVLAVATLLLAAVLVTFGERPPEQGRAALALPLRIAIPAAALVAIAAIAIPLASTGLLRESEAQARAGDPEAALRSARSAQNAEPWAAGPRLQQALVLESEGDLNAALAAARGAAERESTNWRNFLVLSRIEAERGEAAAAVRDYRRARSLNPHSELFER